ISKTLIVISIVPDLAGFPPSTAINCNLMFRINSRSKAFLRTKNGILSSSLSLTRISK
uniref:Uncharacterized protein n=1 Tax=Sinocyclocheilus grahami TaxID=75366 RepID=A0A672SPE6_SINGR